MVSLFILICPRRDCLTAVLLDANKNAIKGKGECFYLQETKKHSEKEDFQSALCGKLNSLCCQFKFLGSQFRGLVRLNRQPKAIKQTA